MKQLGVLQQGPSLFIDSGVAVRLHGMVLTQKGGHCCPNDTRVLIGIINADVNYSAGNKTGCEFLSSMAESLPFFRCVDTVKPYLVLNFIFVQYSNCVAIGNTYHLAGQDLGLSESCEQ